MSEGLGSETTSSRSEPVKHISRLFGWLLVVALLAVPVAVISGDDLTVVSLWGFVSASSSGIVDGYPVWAYFLDQPPGRSGHSGLDPGVAARDRLPPVCGGQRDSRGRVRA